jgi:hypothetical protein
MGILDYLLALLAEIGSRWRNGWTPYPSILVD